MSQAARSASTVTAVIEAAREQFATKGFQATSIDDIASRARVAKGAIYHHFTSKEEIFERVFVRLLSEVAGAVVKSGRPGSNLLDLMAFGTRVYLEKTTAPSMRRILLIDGPAVLGWSKWRELDLKQFGEMTRLSLREILGERISEQELEAALQLLSGAITEAAQIAATARNRKKTIDDLVSAFRRLINGLRAN